MSENAKITTIGAVVGSGHAGPTNYANDVAALDVLVLLLERNISLGILELAHDLHSQAFRLADVEAKRVRRDADRHDAQTHLHFGLAQFFSALHVLVVQQEAR